MTASTEKERASLSAFIEMAEREGFDTAHQWYDAKGWVFFSPSTADCWRYWQAALRAPAVAAQQALHEAAQAVVERWDSPQWKEVPGTASYIADLRAALAAAPQPPDATVNERLTVEAAPVQLPEPVAYMLLDKDEPEAGFIFAKDSSAEWHGSDPLYTEQQVRELLAAHGIEVAP